MMPDQKFPDPAKNLTFYYIITAHYWQKYGLLTHVITAVLAQWMKFPSQTHRYYSSEGPTDL